MNFKNLLSIALVVLITLTTVPHANAQCETLTNIMPEPTINMFSKQGDIDVGRSWLLLMQHDSSTRMSGPIIFRDPEICKYLSKLISKIVAVSPDYAKGFSNEVWIYDDSEMNASHLGGGIFVVTLGAIIQAKSEDELVAILAHETGHMAYRHETAYKTLQSIYNTEYQILNLELTSPLTSH